jgi:hypothetical protein
VKHHRAALHGENAAAAIAQCPQHGVATFGTRGASVEGRPASPGRLVRFYAALARPKPGFCFRLRAGLACEPGTILAETVRSFIQTAVLEIKYGRGWSYLNRCGFLTQKLLDALGQPFRMQNVPTVEQGELRSDAEKLVVRFGKDACTVMQLAPVTAARLEQIAPTAWNTVREDLGVERDVVRCGFRFLAQWPTKNITNARKVLDATGLVKASDHWLGFAGQPTFAAYTGVAVDAKGGRLRVAVDAIEQRVDGALPSGFEGLYPQTAVQLDVDFVYPDEGRSSFSVGPGQLKEFLRSSWERSKEFRVRFDALLAPLLSEHDQ